MLKVTCEIDDYSEPRKDNIRVHNHWRDNRLVDLEINGERHIVDGKQLQRAIDNCMNIGF